MTRWVALLRGVNVAGITVRSADLARLFRDLGLEGVKTVLASGNVLFDSHLSQKELKPQIEAGLRDRFGYDAWIVLVRREELAAAATAYPFPREDETVQPYLLFASDPAVLDELIGLIGETDPAVEAVARGDGVLYWRVRRGITTDSPVGKVLARPRYKSTTTNRNLRTVERLLEA